MKPLDSKSRDDYFRRVADVLIAQIEAGTVPWVQSWQPGERAQPYNVRTGKTYRGGNATWLASVAQMRGYQDERWGTYRQIQESGGHVRRGQKGASIIYWQWEARQLARDNAGKPVLDDKAQPVYEVTKLERPRSYTYTVFNAEQATGLPPRPLRKAGHQWERNERVEKLIKNCGAALEHNHQDRVFYDLGRDLIVMPHREQFPNSAGYYQSAPARTRALDGPSRPDEPGVARGRHPAGPEVAGVFAGGVAGRDQFNDHRGSVGCGARRIENSSVRRLLGQDVERSPPGDLPGEPRRAGHQ